MGEPALDLENTEMSAQGMKLDEGIRQRLSSSEMGNVGSLRHSVLSLIVNSHYDESEVELDNYIASMERYPDFFRRTQRFVHHAKELNRAIKAKRVFRAKSQLSASKQQELTDKILEHFNELKGILTKIERIEIEEKRDDFRSTIWFVRVFTYAVFVLVIAAAIADGLHNEWQSLYAVTDDLSNQISEILIDKLKL